MRELQQVVLLLLVWSCLAVSQASTVSLAGKIFSPWIGLVLSWNSCSNQPISEMKKLSRLQSRRWMMKFRRNIAYSRCFIDFKLQTICINQRYLMIWRRTIHCRESRHINGSHLQVWPRMNNVRSKERVEWTKVYWIKAYKLLFQKNDPRWSTEESD